MNDGSGQWTLELLMKSLTVDGCFKVDCGEVALNGGVHHSPVVPPWSDVLTQQGPVGTEVRGCPQLRVGGGGGGGGGGG